MNRTRWMKRIQQKSVYNGTKTEQKHKKKEENK